MNKHKTTTLYYFRHPKNIDYLKQQLLARFDGSPAVSSYLERCMDDNINIFSSSTEKHDFMYSRAGQGESSNADGTMDYASEVACLNWKFLEHYERFIAEEIFGRNDYATNITRGAATPREQYAVVDGLNSSARTAVMNARQNIVGNDTGFLDQLSADGTPLVNGSQNFADKRGATGWSSDTRSVGAMMDEWRYVSRGVSIRDDPVGEIVRDKNAPRIRDQVQYPYGNEILPGSYAGHVNARKYSGARNAHPGVNDAAAVVRDDPAPIHGEYNNPPGVSGPSADYPLAYYSNRPHTNPSVRRSNIDQAPYFVGERVSDPNARTFRWNADKKVMSRKEQLLREIGKSSELQVSGKTVAERNPVLDAAEGYYVSPAYTAGAKVQNPRVKYNSSTVDPDDYNSIMTTRVSPDYPSRTAGFVWSTTADEYTAEVLGAESSGVYGDFSAPGQGTTRSFVDGGHVDRLLANKHIMSLNGAAGELPVPHAVSSTADAIKHRKNTHMQYENRYIGMGGKAFVTMIDENESFRGDPGHYHPGEVSVPNEDLLGPHATGGQIRIGADNSGRGHYAANTNYVSKPQSMHKLWQDGSEIFDTENPTEMNKLLNRRVFRSWAPGKYAGPGMASNNLGQLMNDNSKLMSPAGDTAAEQIPYWRRKPHSRHYDRDADESIGGFETDAQVRGYGRHMDELYANMAEKAPCGRRKPLPPGYKEVNRYNGLIYRGDIKDVRDSDPSYAYK